MKPERMHAWRRVSAAVCLTAAMCLAGCEVKDTILPRKGPPIPTEIGKRIVITPESLPPPFDTPSANNGPRIVPKMTGANFQVPAGFAVTLFAEGDFKQPRWLIEGPNGDLFLSDAAAGVIHLLRDTNRDGRIDNATERFKFLQGLNLPFGMAIRDGFFYVANTDSVLRFPYQPGETKAAGAVEKIIDLPGKGYNQHWTRNLLFSPDGKKLYVTVGSETNVSVEADPRRAAIGEYNPDGTGHRIFAGGLRNPIGLAWNGGRLWTTVNERDGLGDDLVPDYFTSVADGGFYGWPYFYIGNNEDPRNAGRRPDLGPKTIVPDVLFEAHGAALGLAFYTGTMFPEAYRGDAFVALHGSWNRSRRSGYKIVRIPFENGKPEGGYENFLTGWVSDPDAAEVWGRPVGVLAAADGALLIVDDGGNRIWRVTYGK